mmetsp:Transcript_21366/g.33048  ORF Transcript_21366/g.33048 Transcript_21366/m.33048 type:complete len:216 (+) Transcript_21366:249-896(+)|eukprot:CAMPEP_0170492038 /NCGR_PEP_ID=MMETSP0208-20121228/11580_1 /TAXON_ID=197538 /ORGANISM="Strombidium inclinatum, Strain S3" /LENGTH=215 /DNA_ID=CAMNT_0010767723 /DNA_START=243 /DNA_END=893 /DNA_ORIENTATION=-
MLTSPGQQKAPLVSQTSPGGTTTDETDTSTTGDAANEGSSTGGDASTEESESAGGSDDVGNNDASDMDLDNMKTTSGMKKSLDNTILSQLNIPTPNYEEVKEFVQWFFYQLLNDMFLYNIEDCTFWVFDTVTDGLNGVLLLIEDNKPLDALMSVAYSIHKGPITYFSCERVVTDYTSILAIYNTATFSDEANYGDLIVNLFWNSIFNAADIFYQS